MLRLQVGAMALFLLTAGSAGADLKKGREKLAHGDYRAAIQTLEETTGANRFDAQLLKVDALRRLGEWERAEKLARKLARASGDRGVRGQVELASVLRDLGRHAEARRLLEPISARGMNLDARYQLAMVYRETGDLARAETLFKSIYDHYQARKLDEKDPTQVFYLAQAGRYRESFQFANSFFADAVSLDPKFHIANVEWGHLLLYKYNIADAERSFDEVLKIDPNHPDAHAGVARVKLEQNYDLAAAGFHLDKALEVNPRHIGSLQIRAELETDKNQWAKAEATLREILAINPNHTGAHAQLATIYWLRDEEQKYEQQRNKAFAINPKFAEFYHVVARSAVREHRYKEAIELEQEALKVDPSYYRAMAEVGTGHLRMGEEKKGLTWLRRAYDKDPYNVRTVNLLELFEKVIPRNYAFVKSKNFRFRLHKDERPMYERYIAPTLERAFEDMIKRYKFRPKVPVTIELYQDPDHYSVRTVGLPNLGALGVCFGQVITARSPSAGDLNWGMVMWHELAHVFAIQISDSRVPRWYTEGLSEYETLIARPEWRRENDADLYSALVAKKIPSVAELNYGFMKPDMQEVVVAYYLSAVVIEYVAETYGFDKVVEGLELFGKGLETPEVIERITGKKVAAFDIELRSYLEQRLAPYKGSFRLPSSGYDDLDALKAATRKDSTSATAWAELALGHYFEGDARRAQKAADKALELDEDNAIALYISAELALRGRKIADAKKLYQTLIRSGHDGAEVRGRLGMIATHEKKLDEAEKHLCAAKKLDPEQSYPYQALADLYRTRKQPDRALAEMETYVHLEQMQYQPVKELVDALFAKKAWAKVVHYGEMALYINPSDSDLLLKLARGYRETGAHDRALYTYDSALMARPALPRPAMAHTGRAAVLLAQGKRAAARAALTQALKLEPNYKAALDLEAQLTRP